MPTGNTASGFIEVEVSGGSQPYQYSIDGISNGTLNEFSGLEAGNYQITVIDANGCFLSLPTITIAQIAVDNSIAIASDGVLSANYKDAISYQWINVDTRERIAGATNVDFTPTDNGRYQVEMEIDDTVIVLSLIHI